MSYIHVYYVCIYIYYKYIIIYVDNAFDARSWSLSWRVPRLDKELKEILGSQGCELNAVSLVTLATILKGVEQ